MVRASPVEPITPIVQKRRQKMTCPDIISSPSTPHRIELRNDTYCEDVSRIAKNIPPPTKTRRRLKKGETLVSVQDIKNSKPQNHTIPEYFQVRRSVRKTTKTVLEEKQRDLELALKKGTEEGLEVRIFEGKGRGIVASKYFAKGDFVVEYSGELIDPVEAKLREEKYSLDQNAGCYMYYFRNNNQQYCIDATAETGKLGRLVNHSRNGNLMTRTILIENKPRLVLIAKEDIKTGEEILYDYGDRSKESLKHHPWLAY